jgi:hypothetical protein
VGNRGGEGELIDPVSRRAMVAGFKIGVVARRFGWLRAVPVASRNGSVMPWETLGVRWWGS